MALVYLSLGSNLGDRAQNLVNAKNFIQEDIGAIIAESSIYKNRAVGFDGDDFYNQVIKIETTLTPQTLLKKIEKIEKTMGRKEKTVWKNDIPIYTNRIIDIDILLYDDLQIDTKELTIPHPRMYERDFVLSLLNEIMNYNNLNIFE